MNASQKKNILLVDDDPFLQCLYRKTLEREGYDLLTANDGLAAIEKLPEHSPDLVVLDLMLPKMDGLQVLESIRSNRRYHDLPVLILSNAYLPQVAQKAMQAGATSGILKSECSPKKLVKIVREILAAAPARDSQAPECKNSRISDFLGQKTEPTRPDNSTDNQSAEAESPEASTSTETQKDLRKSWPAEIAMMRGTCMKYAKAAGTPEAEDYLKEIYRRLRLLSARSIMADWSQISEMSSALEAMLFERGFNPGKRMSQSAVQTMFQAVDCLEYLLRTGMTVRLKATHKTRVLLVDDDPVSNRANELALKRVNFDTVCASDGGTALALLENSRFDLILMDINMPGLNGLDACEKLRALPGCKDVAVIFVTLQDDFKSRAQSVLCGGNGLIAKPISPLELIVKALIFLLHPHNAMASKPAKEKTTSGITAVDNGPASSAAFQQEPPITPTAQAGPVRTTDEQAADCARLMGQLEAALANTQKEKDKLTEEAAAANSLRRTELDVALVENEKKQAILVKQIEETWMQFEAQQMQPPAQPQVLPTREPPADRPEVASQIKDLTEALSAATSRCESAERQAASLRQQLAEQTQLLSITAAELEGFRQCASAETAHQEQMAR